jgi:parvulin-like peptidyl-prolyl isomerase
MLAAFRPFRSRRLRRVALTVGGVAAVAVGVWCARGVLVHRAAAQPAGAAPAPAAPGPAQPATTSDYANRVVAYIHGNHAITRQELGEYLVARYGAEKLPLMLNKRLLDKACAERGVVVSLAEIDAALARDLKGLAVDQATFIKTVLSKYKKNLYEWREDVLRPRLQMMKLVQNKISVTPEELRKVYEATYGEKVECRIILWPAGQEKQAAEEYGRLRDSESAFAEKAKKQAKSDLAASGGKIKPVGRWTLDEKVEREVFKLRPGEVTTLVQTPEGLVMVKCDRRIPADTTVNFDSVKEKLSVDIQERKLQAEMAVTFQAMRDQAKLQPLLKKSERGEPGPTPPPSQVVAYLYGAEKVTREELGEYLIARYGAEKLEFLVNRRIIDLECQAKKITVSDAEVDAALKEDLKMLGVDKVHFEKDLLARWGKNLYEWREDVIRPKLMLTKLCQGRVKCTEEDVKHGYEAHYGERLQCRMIVYPTEQAKFATLEYNSLRDSEEAFARKAKSQPIAALASKGGVIPEFGRHTLGLSDDEAAMKLEREAFKLQPGEISALIGTPQGQVVIKCDKRIGARTDVKLEKVRGELTQEILQKKTQLEMQVVFKDLHQKANPRLLLKSPNLVEDLAASTREAMSGLPPVAGKQPGTKK